MQAKSSPTLKRTGIGPAMAEGRAALARGRAGQGPGGCGLGNGRGIGQGTGLLVGAQEPTRPIASFMYPCLRNLDLPKRAPFTGRPKLSVQVRKLIHSEVLFMEYMAMLYVKKVRSGIIYGDGLFYGGNEKKLRGLCS
jgi:hypothetical protein